MTRYWVIAPYEANFPMFNKIWEFDKINSVISIGWRELGDISQLTKEELKIAYEGKFGNTNSGSITRTVNMLWNFFHEIQEGDIILARKGTKKLLAIGTVKGKAYFDEKKNTDLVSESPNDYFHSNFIDIQWHDSPVNKIYDNHVVFGIQTLYEIDGNEYRGLVENLTNNEIAIIEEVSEKIENHYQFFMEKYLEQFIIDNFHHIFGDKIQLLRDDQHNIIKNQYRTDIGVIDILGFEQDTNSFVVIELKKGRESDKVVGQALRYMGWISEKLCNNGQTVKGIIICEKADDKLYYATKAVPNIELKYYHIDFNLTDSV